MINTKNNETNLINIIFVKGVKVMGFSISGETSRLGLSFGAYSDFLKSLLLSVATEVTKEESEFDTLTQFFKFDDENAFMIPIFCHPVMGGICKNGGNKIADKIDEFLNSIPNDNERKDVYEYIGRGLSENIKSCCDCGTELHWEFGSIGGSIIGYPTINFFKNHTEIAFNAFIYHYNLSKQIEDIEYCNACSEAELESKLDLIGKYFPNILDRANELEEYKFLLSKVKEKENTISKMDKILSELGITLDSEEDDSLPF